MKSNDEKTGVNRIYSLSSLTKSSDPRVDILRSRLVLSLFPELSVQERWRHQLYLDFQKEPVFFLIILFPVLLVKLILYIS